MEGIEFVSTKKWNCWSLPSFSFTWNTADSVERRAPPPDNFLLLPFSYYLVLFLIICSLVVPFFFSIYFHSSSSLPPGSVLVSVRVWVVDFFFLSLSLSLSSSPYLLYLVVFFFNIFYFFFLRLPLFSFFFYNWFNLAAGTAGRRSFHSYFFFFLFLFFFLVPNPFLLRVKAPGSTGEVLLFFGLFVCLFFRFFFFFFRRWTETGVGNQVEQVAPSVPRKLGNNKTKQNKTKTRSGPVESDSKGNAVCVMEIGCFVCLFVFFMKKRWKQKQQ